MLLILAVIKYLILVIWPQRLATKIENKIPDDTPEFNRLTKKDFYAKMKQKVKSLLSKSQVDNAIDIADKNKEKINHYNTRLQSGFY